MDNFLYVLQYDDDPYCAPYSGEIFVDRDTAFNYIKDNELKNFRCVTVYEHDAKIKGYKELYDLYCDLLEEYADKKPSRINGKLRPVHLSEMNTEQAGRFIDSLLLHLATLCDLNIDLQSEVRKFIYEWEEWKNKPENEFEEFSSLEEIREKVRYSEASGKGGALHLHHIVTRGACPAAVDKTWNIMVLTPDEHNFYHQQCKTWDEFLEVYPHLRGKVERAQRKCAELVQQNNSIGNLVDMALGNKE